MSTPLLTQAENSLRAGGWEVLVTADLAQAREYLAGLLAPGESLVRHSSAAWDLLAPDGLLAARGIAVHQFGPAHPAHDRTPLLQAKVGVTGATAVVAETGTVILAEEDGHGRLVSNLPYTHVVIAPLYKLLPTLEDGLDAAQQYSQAAFGKPAPRYISGISGPSKTGDIEFVIVHGMHGPGRVHIILLDVGEPPGQVERFTP